MYLLGRASESKHAVYNVGSVSVLFPGCAVCCLLVIFVGANLFLLQWEF